MKKEAHTQTHTPPPPPPKPFSSSVPTALCVTCKKMASVVDMPDVDHAGSGAARRRRERRLRAWLRHERQSVAAAVAEALHHSAGPREKVVERRGRQEGEVHETHNALRSQTTPLPGKRPTPLSEVTGPQVAVTDGYVAAGVPLLGAPSLADSSAEAIDGSTLSFLLQHALEVKRKEEEEAVETGRAREAGEEGGRGGEQAAGGAPAGSGRGGPCHVSDMGLALPSGAARREVVRGEG